MNPEEMTDEQLQTVIDTGKLPEVDGSKEEEEPVKPQEEVPKEDEEEVEKPKETEEESEEEVEEEEEKPVSRREQLRINDLLKKYPHLREAAKEQPAAPKKQASDFIKNLDADQEVIDQLQADRQAYSDEAYQAGLKQMELREFKRDLKYETPTVLTEFPFLNPTDKANYKQAAADAMNQKYLRFVGYNPGNADKGVPESVQYSDVSYADFVRSEMEFVDELASKKVAESTKNIVKQAAKTGLRPDGSSTKRLNLNQAPEDMSIEELYAKIGQTPPKQP